MKRIVNRMGSILLCVVLCLTLMPTAAFATESDNVISVTSVPFADVSSDQWYYNSVAYVYENGLMNGSSNNTFEPDSGLTRGMFVTILGRMAGIDQNSYNNSSFSDVTTGQWYSAYVEWAKQNNITQGVGDGQFGWNQPISREQMATFISRYVSSANIVLKDADDPVPAFKDADTVSSWAGEGMELMRKSGIIKGDTDGNFRPSNSATRAEAATIFMRLDSSIKNHSISIAATGSAAVITLMLGGEDCLVVSDANTVSSAASTGIFDSLPSTEALWEGSGNVTISDAALSTLIEKKPDLVVESSGSNGLTSDQIGKLQNAGISYLVLPPMTDLDSVKTAVNTMAQVLGDKTSKGEKNAEEIASEFCTWVDNACSDIKDATKEYEYQAETDEDNRTTVLVDTAYTLYVDDWDSEAHYKLSNSRFAQMEGDGCAVVKIGPSESSTTISNFLGYANVINTSSKYGVVGQIKYFTPLVSSYLDWEITGPKADGVVKSGQPLLQQDDASLGTPYFPKVIASSAEVRSQIENSPMWRVYPHINTGGGNFNSDGFLDQEGHIVSTQISGEYEIVVNPKGLISDWTTGGCESILESLWAGWEFFDAISESDLKGYITDFYSTFYGYDLSSAQLDDILKGA